MEKDDLFRQESSIHHILFSTFRCNKNIIIWLYNLQSRVLFLYLFTYSLLLLLLSIIIIIIIIITVLIITISIIIICVIFIITLFNSLFYL